MPIGESVCNLSRFGRAMLSEDRPIRRSDSVMDGAPRQVGCSCARSDQNLAAGGHVLDLQLRIEALPDYAFCGQFRCGAAASLPSGTARAESATSGTERGQADDRSPDG